MERGQGRGPISRAAPRPGCGDNPEGKSKQGEDYPEVQWLRLCFHYRGYGFDPWGTKIPHAVLCIQKFLFKKERETRGNTKSEVPFLPSLLPLSWPHYNAPKLRVCVCVCVCVCVLRGWSKHSRDFHLCLSALTSETGSRSLQSSQSQTFCLPVTYHKP